jgi:hypothetical protein
MPTDLTKYLDGAKLPSISAEDMAGAMAEATDATTSGGGDGVQFLSFSGKMDVYALGRDKTPIDPDQLYLVEPQSLVRGYICWKGSKPVGRVGWSIYEPEKEVNKSDLQDYGPYRDGEGWNDLLAFGCVEATEARTSVSFSSSSVSGRNAIGGLIEEIRTRLLAGDPYVPLITFGSESFMAQDQKNYKPVLDVDCWLTREQSMAWFDGRQSLDDAMAGKKPRKAKGKGKK